ncbi:trypsin-like peptidase domain-containing protein [Kibdelosporangium lantanae]
MSEYGYGAWPPPPPPPRRRPRGYGLVLGFFVLVLAVAIGVAGWSIGHGSSSRGSFFPGAQPQRPQSEQVGDPSAAGKVAPGLVDVNTELGLQGKQAAGTGIVLTANGEVLTNNHVVEGATRIVATDIGNGRTYSAKVVGYDRSEDIAVIQLQNASGLTTAPIGDSAKAAVGDAILGIGNAGGVGGDPDVAPGRIVALDQSITASDESGGSSEQLKGLIQVDANIQAGDSGGALANDSGAVIGVNTAASAGYELGRGGRQVGGTQGFAIPINQALDIAKQIESGKASPTVHIGETAIIGVTVADTAGGAGIQDVLSGGPAAGAGITGGSVITAVDGQTIDSATALTHVLDQHHPKDTVKVTWTDQAGHEHTADVKLGAGPVG